LSVAATEFTVSQRGVAMHLCYDGNLLITLLQICCWITQLKDFSKIGQQIFGVIMTTDVVVWRKKLEKSHFVISGVFFDLRVQNRK